MCCIHGCSALNERDDVRRVLELCKIGNTKTTLAHSLGTILSRNASTATVRQIVAWFEEAVLIVDDPKLAFESRLATRCLACPSSYSRAEKPASRYRSCISAIAALREDVLAEHQCGR